MSEFMTPPKHTHWDFQYKTLVNIPKMEPVRFHS